MNGYDVLGIDKESTEEIIRVQLNNEQNDRFTFKQSSFEELEQLPKADLIVSLFSLPFCNPMEFDKLWNNISNSIYDEKYFLGNFFGVNDEWNGKKQMSFFTLEQIRKLFEDFEIISICENEYDKQTAMGKMKHWDVIEVLAIHKKINN